MHSTINQSKRLLVCPMDENEMYRKKNREYRMLLNAHAHVAMKHRRRQYLLFRIIQENIRNRTETSMTTAKKLSM